MNIIRGRGKAIKYPTYVHTSRGAPATRKRNIRRHIAIQLGAWEISLPLWNIYPVMQAGMYL
ncbi:MAG TPA: hypothetical protein VJ799_08900 [Nitrososphaeraceae archaeon]|nr:hypothetical protein [Nitrososphaeraceae archaeon]